MPCTHPATKGSTPLHLRQLRLDDNGRLFARVVTHRLGIRALLSSGMAARTRRPIKKVEEMPQEPRLNRGSFIIYRPPKKN
jgi:hypothetical protein